MPYPEEMTPERAAWLRQRADEIRRRWKESETAMRDAGQSIEREIAALRQIDGDLPFMMLTMFLQRELERSL